MSEWHIKYVDSIVAEMINDYAWSLREEFQIGMDLCESPIEQAMLAALRIVLEQHFQTDVGPVSIARIPYKKWPQPYGPYQSITIFPQSSIGDYRVDFLIYVHDGQRIFWLAVECDGHDFHERTKQQAKRDRSRDRWMNINGLPVLRFTGSEIYADAAQCADEVAEFIAKKLCEEISG